MSSLLRKAGHVGKQAVKFVYTARVHELTGVPADCGPITVVWTRGPRVVNFQVRAPTAGSKSIVWDEEQSMVVTLYRKGQKGFDKKEAKFSIKEQRGPKLKKVGSIVVDLATYASLDGAAFNVTFPLNDKVKNGPSITLTFTTRWVKNYSGQGDDVASQMTDMTDISRLSAGAHSRGSDATADQDLDDFPELNDDSVVGNNPNNSGLNHSASSPSQASHQGSAGSGLTAAALAAQASSGGSHHRSTSSSSTNDQVARLTRENAELRSQVADLTAKAARAPSNPNPGNTRQVTELEEEVAELQGKLDLAEEEWAKNRAEIDSLTEECSDLRSKLDEAGGGAMSRVGRSGTVVAGGAGGGGRSGSADGEGSAGEIAALRATIQALEEEKSALERAKVELEEENRAVEDIVEPLQEENDTLAEKVASLERDLDAVVARAGSAEESEKRIRELVAEAESLSDDKSKAEIRVRELEEELAMVKDNMSDLQATQNTLASELGHMRGSTGSREEAHGAGSGAGSGHGSSGAGAGGASSSAMASASVSRAKVRSLEAEVARLRQVEATIDELTGQLIAAKLELAEVTGDKYVLEQQCKNLKRDVEKYRANAQRLGSQVAQLEIKVESARGH